MEKGSGEPDKVVIIVVLKEGWTKLSSSITDFGVGWCLVISDCWSHLIYFTTYRAQEVELKNKCPFYLWNLQLSVWASQSKLIAVGVGEEESLGLNRLKQ